MSDEKEIFWLLKPHCEKAKQVKQVDGQTAYKCEH